MYARKPLLYGVLLIMLATAALGVWYNPLSWFSSSEVSALSPSGASSSSFDGYNVRLGDRRYEIYYGVHEINLTPFAVLCGNPMNVQAYTNWWNDDNGWGWELTPPTKASADCLQAVALRVDSDVPLRKVAERLQYVTRAQDGEIPEEYVESDFTKITASYEYINESGATDNHVSSRIMQYNGKTFIVWDFKNLSFTAGEPISFTADPFKVVQGE